MKKKKILLVLIIAAALAVGIIITVLNILHDDNRLSISEKEWISNNKNNVISLNVINDLNIFGKDGKGVYFDFLNSLAEEYNFQINPVTFNSGEEVGGLSLNYSISNDLNSFYDDEFILVSKNVEKFENINEINSLKIGITNNFKEYISTYLNSNNEFIEFESKDELLKNFKDTTDLNYIVVPKIMYLSDILKENYHIVYHISDAKIHLGVTKDGSELANIISKYFTIWKKKNFEKSLNQNELELFVNSLEISSFDVDKIKANNYVYGFVNNEPYELISGGTFGGINATYLKKFADLLDIKIDFVKYKNKDELNSAISENKVNIYFDYYNLDTLNNSIPSNILISFYIVVKQDNSLVVNSLNSLKDVYVEENTRLYEYLKHNTNLNILTYKNNKELKKIIKEDVIIAIDSNKYESYKDNLLDDFIVRYNYVVKDSYNFVANDSEVFNKLFTKYLETIDNNEMKYIGLNNYFITKKSGTLFGTIAKYILFLLGLFILIMILVYKKSKRIKLAHKIKREDKMRFIDQLTSLKNRNYLTENLTNWNNNKIYPQAVIVLDLNKLQDINDTLGYEKGDIQIQSAANILIKTQIDNSDIIRTDGNEFLIYLVGYETKQITSYIHKLNKEFKKLPFEYGVAIGYSMITDDVKSVEDAINEAVEQVKIQKEEIKDE